MSSKVIQQRINEAIERLGGAKVGVVGDLVADLYVSGQSERVSREAPVLIVRYEDEWLRPGGAANVAANVCALGATAFVVGLVGDDEAGHRLVNLMRASGDGQMQCEHILACPNRETISKTRFLAGAKLTSRQQVLRLDRQPTQPPDAKLLDEICQRIADADRHVDAWIASDYGYGSFDDKLRKLLQTIAKSKCVVADSRWELHRFTGMTVIKPNEEEAAAIAHRIACSAPDETSLAQILASRLHAQSVLITLGNAGMVLATKGRTTRIATSGSDEIVDLTGAGDSVAATLTTALASGSDIETAARLANHAGGIVVMKEGAATVSPAELSTAVSQSGEQT